jgi:hypothetical protein
MNLVYQILERFLIRLWKSNPIRLMETIFGKQDSNRSLHCFFFIFLFGKLSKHTYTITSIYQTTTEEFIFDWNVII